MTDDHYLELGTAFGKMMEEMVSVHIPDGSAVTGQITFALKENQMGPKLAGNWRVTIEKL